MKLRHLEDWTEARRAHARVYNQLLAAGDLRILVQKSEVRHVYHLLHRQECDT